MSPLGSRGAVTPFRDLPQRASPKSSPAHTRPASRESSVPTLPVLLPVDAGSYRQTDRASAETTLLEEPTRPASNWTATNPEATLRTPPRGHGTHATGLAQGPDDGRAGERSGRSLSTARGAAWTGGPLMAESENWAGSRSPRTTSRLPIAITTSRATSKASSCPKVMPGSPRPSAANGNALADAAGAISFSGALTGSAMR